ncbi:MAG: hypothetical protein KatS3mg013_1636 [Actinomycetota bacterium]|jgi:DNA-binding transcriptional regulator YhcF (GntR family)|nr:MAG: hypothetical protein KatS3mg013_1636 [Actinomycetota bacterium]
MGRPALTARDIKEAIEERILRGHYAPGGPLPSVRQLGAELGASPSTVSRALQELEREGWVQVASRRGAVVARTLPRTEGAHTTVEAQMQRLAMRWRLSGRSRDELERIVTDVIEEVFRPEPTVYFLECNPVDLARMTAEVQREAPEHRVVPMLIEEARAGPGVLAGRTVIVPFFHLADVRAFLTDDVDLVPLNFAPAQEFMRALAELPQNTRIGVIARDERSRRRIEGLVHQYSLAQVRSVTVDRLEEVDRLIRDSDVIVTANSAAVPPERLAAARRTLTVEFALERGELGLSRLLLRDPAPAAAETVEAG